MGGFASVLFDGARSELPPELPADEPDFFRDLNLDQVVRAVTGGREEYDLPPFYFLPLRDVAAVEYRHEVVRDLQRPQVREAVEEFAVRMRRVRAHLAQAGSLRHPLQKQRWFLDAVDVHCTAVTALADRLTRLDLAARGLRGLREHVVALVGAPPFRDLAAATHGLRERLASIRYGVHIRTPRVTVQPYAGDTDYGTEVEETFARFRQGTVDDHRTRFPEYADMNHVEAQVLDRVAVLHPEIFRELAAHADRYAGFRDPTVDRFDREVQFYLAYLSFTERLTRSGLPFCLPRLSDDVTDTVIEGGFDLALATRLGPERTPVANDVDLHGRERVVVVTGPNQGGKTTFARMVGQIPHLASLGLPVPARRAELTLPDRVFSVFEREENVADLRGRLDGELVRIRDALAAATARSVIVLNESFASTTLHDARFIGTEVLQRIVALGPLTVYVTFVDELASLADSVVSVVGAVDPDDPARRTFRIERRPADGLAHAAAIATRHGLTYESMRRRITG